MGKIVTLTEKMFLTTAIPTLCRWKWCFGPFKKNSINNWTVPLYYGSCCSLWLRYRLFGFRVACTNQRDGCKILVIALSVKHEGTRCERITADQLLFSRTFWGLFYHTKLTVGKSLGQTRKRNRYICILNETFQTWVRLSRWSNTRMTRLRNFSKCKRKRFIICKFIHICDMYYFLFSKQLIRDNDFAGDRCTFLMDLRLLNKRTRVYKFTCKYCRSCYMNVIYTDVITVFITI